MESTILRRFAQKLNRPHSRYKTGAAEVPVDDSSKSTEKGVTGFTGEQPVYQEINDISDSTRRKNHASTREHPLCPPPYSGSLVNRIRSFDDESMFSVGTSHNFRDRCQSSSFLEERITTQLIVSKNRASTGSSTHSISSNSPSMDSSSSLAMSTNDSDIVHDHDRRSTVDTAPTAKQDTAMTSNLKGAAGQADPTSSNKPEPEKEAAAMIDHDNADSDTYILMAATDSIKESISTPLLSEDNMYVTMSPIPSQKKLLQRNDSTRDYYNLHSSGGSLPNLMHSESIELEEEDEAMPLSTSQTQQQLGNLYEEIDFSRPIPPPRRKKLLRLQNSAMAKSRSFTPPPPPSSPVLRHNSVLSSQQKSPLYRHVTLRERTGSTPVTNRRHTTKGGTGGRKRPVGMVFNDTTVMEIPSNPEDAS